MTQNSRRGRPGATARRATGLRASSFASVVMLLTEFGLGIWVDYDDIFEAAEAVQTASLLMRILGREEDRLLAAARPAGSSSPS